MPGHRSPLLPCWVLPISVDGWKLITFSIRMINNWFTQRKLKPPWQRSRKLWTRTLHNVDCVFIGIIFFLSSKHLLQWQTSISSWCCSSGIQDLNHLHFSSLLLGKTVSLPLSKQGSHFQIDEGNSHCHSAFSWFLTSWVWAQQNGQVWLTGEELSRKVQSWGYISFTVQRCWQTSAASVLMAIEKFYFTKRLLYKLNFPPYGPTDCCSTDEIYCVWRLFFVMVYTHIYPEHHRCIFAYIL